MRLLGHSPSPHIVRAALLMSLLIWAGTSVIAKVTVDHFPVYLTLFLRFLVASILILPLLLGHSQIKKTPQLKHYIYLILVCFFGFTMQIGLFFLGISKASILDMSIIVMLSPLLVAMVGWWWLGEPHQGRNLVGLLVAALGATLGIALSAGAPGHHSTSGNLLLLGSELAVVIYAIGSKKLSTYFSPQVIAASSFSVAMLTFAVYTLLDPSSAPSLSSISGAVILGLAYLAVLSSVVAYVSYEWTLEHLQASTVAAFSYVQPLASAMLAMIFLHEQLTIGWMIGASLTIAGIWLALSHPSHKGKKAKDVLHTSHARHR